MRLKLIDDCDGHDEDDEHEGAWVDQHEVDDYEGDVCDCDGHELDEHD